MGFRRKRFMAYPLTKFGTVATGLLAPLALSLGNPTKAIGSNEVNPRIINPGQPTTTLVERGSESRLFNNPDTLVAETPRDAIANSQGGRFQFENGEEGSRIITDTQTRAIDTARDAQERKEEALNNIGGPLDLDLILKSGENQ